jgi:hypothetical protein
MQSCFQTETRREGMSVLETEKVPFVDDTPRSEEKVVEVPVLLESRLLTALEATASEHGMTTGKMVRRLIRDFLCYSEDDLPNP